MVSTGHMVSYVQLGEGAHEPQGAYLAKAPTETPRHTWPEASSNIIIETNKGRHCKSFISSRWKQKQGLAISRTFTPEPTTEG